MVSDDSRTYDPQDPRNRAYEEARKQKAARARQRAREQARLQAEREKQEWREEAEQSQRQRRQRAQQQLQNQPWRSKFADLPQSHDEIRERHKELEQTQRFHQQRAREQRAAHQRELDERQQALERNGKRQRQHVDDSLIQGKFAQTQQAQMEARRRRAAQQQAAQQQAAQRQQQQELERARQEAAYQQRLQEEAYTARQQTVQQRQAAEQRRAAEMQAAQQQAARQSQEEAERAYLKKMAQRHTQEQSADLPGTQQMRRVEQLPRRQVVTQNVTSEEARAQRAAAQSAAAQSAIQGAAAQIPRSSAFQQVIPEIDDPEDDFDVENFALPEEDFDAQPPVVPATRATAGPSSSFKRSAYVGAGSRQGQQRSVVNRLKDTTGGEFRFSKKLIAIIVAIFAVVVILFVVNPFGCGASDPEQKASAPSAATNAKPTSASLPTPIMSESTGLLMHSAVPMEYLTEILIHNASYGYANEITTKLTEATNTEIMESHGTGRVAAEQPTGNAWMTGEFIRCFRSGNAGPTMSAIDCGGPVGTKVYAPVTGTVVLVKEYKLYNEIDDYRVHIQPEGRPDLDVVLIHLTDVTVQAGDQVIGGETPIGSIRDVYQYLGESLQLGQYTAVGDNGNHTHIQVNNVNDPEYHGLDDLKPAASGTEGDDQISS